MKVCLAALLILQTSLLVQPNLAQLGGFRQLLRRLYENGVNSRLLNQLKEGKLQGFDLIAIEELDFGVDPIHGAWFEFQDELGNTFAYSGLDHNPYLTLGAAQQPQGSSARARSTSYMKVDSQHAISMLIHNDSDVTISAWSIQQKEGEEAVEEALPSFHLSHRQQINHADYSHGRRLLKETTASYFVAYEYDTTFKQGTCGALVVQNIVDEETGNPQQMYYNIDDFDFSTHSSRSGKTAAGGKRRGLSTASTNPDVALSNMFNKLELPDETKKPRRLSVSRADNCFEDIDSPRFIEVSFVADVGYFNSFDNEEENLSEEEKIGAVTRSVETIVANANIIYFFQFNVRIVLRQLLIITEPFTAGVEEMCASSEASRFSQTFSQDPKANTCCTEIGNAQQMMSSFSASLGTRLIGSNEVLTAGGTSSLPTVPYSRAAHWHLLSDCYPANCPDNNCVIGLSIQSGDANAESKALVCDFSASGGNIGISSRTFQTWLTFTHELGHNLGADHSFENGRGNTGGVMDYGDGKIDGQYQFNALRFPELCRALDVLIRTGSCNLNSNFQFLDDLPNFCSGEADFNKPTSKCGICINNTCVPLQFQLRMADESLDGNETNPNRFPNEYLIEVAEFSPLSLDDDRIIQGPLAVADPSTACSALNDDFTGQIVIIERGGCSFKEKVDNLISTGAIAAVVYNNENGAPKPIGGENFRSLPIVSISRDDGLEILATLDALGGDTLDAALGGFAVSNKTLDFIPESIFVRFKVIFITFFVLTIPALALYFGIRYRDYLKEKAIKVKENVEDAAIENRYRLINQFERGSMMFRRSQIFPNMRPTSQRLDSAEIEVPVPTLTSTSRMSSAVVAANV